MQSSLLDYNICKWCKYLVYGFTLLCYSACNQTIKIKSGYDAFHAGQFYLAKNLYLNEIEGLRDKNLLNQKYNQLAQCYKYMNQPDSALVWVEILANSNPTVDHLVSLAEALNQVGQYERAKSTFVQIEKDFNLPGLYRTNMAALDRAIKWTNDIDLNPYKIKRLDINTDASEYSAILDGQGMMVFSSDGDESDLPYLWTGRGFSDFVAADSGGKKKLDFQSFFNTPNNEGSLAYDNHFSQVVFSRCFSTDPNLNQYCRIMYSHKVNDLWTDPIAIPLGMDSINCLSPCFGSSNDIIFYSADNSIADQGFDLYFTRSDSTGWSQPIALPSVINSPYDEKFPFAVEDTLYFASNKPGGMGGLDIYKTYKRAGGWSVPENLAAPINSAYDDFGWYLISNKTYEKNISEKGYFTSNRNNGPKNDNIYSFVKKIPEVIPPPMPRDSNSFSSKVNIYVYGYGVSNGKIDESTSHPLQSAQVKLLQTGVFDTMSNTDRLGKVSFDLILNKNKKLEYFASHPGYLSSSKLIDPNILPKNDSLTVQEFSFFINLYPILYEQEIVIKDIYYDYDKYNIRVDAVKSLDELLSILKLNADIKIRINSYTDCRGSDQYNAKLSAQRSNSVVKYLIANGIAADRLTSFGFGESKPLAKCVCESCSEEQHQLNRRTTFQLVK